MHLSALPLSPFASIFSLMTRIGTNCSTDITTCSLDPSKVSLQIASSGRWQLIRNGTPYAIRGAGGFTHLELLSDLGGNTIRTWSTDQLGPTLTGFSVLDQCTKLGLTAMVGLWVNQPRHGFDYGDQTMLQTQRDRIRSDVRKIRHHPAVLMWGLGNEMEGDGQDPRVWRELEVLTQIIKAEDPDHPVCSVLAGTGGDKIRAMQQHFTSVDILGINIYARADSLDTALAAQGWNKPFLLTEFGPHGHWEVALTPWQAPIEQTPAEKAASYTRSYRNTVQHGRGLCLGAFAFLWGQKQERTPTWYSMFLPTGEKTPVVDAIAQLWSGQKPTQPSPVIHGLQASFRETSATPDSIHQVTVEVANRNPDSLIYDWRVVAESTERKEGGDPETAPPEIPGCVLQSEGPTAAIRLPKNPGPYRVFVYVRDGLGGGSSANFPFLVK